MKPHRMTADERLDRLRRRCVDVRSSCERLHAQTDFVISISRAQRAAAHPYSRIRTVGERGWPPPLSRLG